MSEWYSTTEQLPPEGITVTVFQTEYENYPPTRRDSIEMDENGWKWTNLGYLRHAKWRFVEQEEES